MSNELNIHTSNKTALIFGNTGLTGSICEELLLKNPAYQKVITFGRRPVSLKGEKHLHHVIDFKDIERYHDLIRGDDLYLCLGTTMAKAGSKEAFYAVDYEMNYKIANIASENNVRQLLLISAVGADPNSFFFYNRVKGELEDAVQKLTFWAIHIFQPSMILGERNESRPLESIAQKIMKSVDATLF